jgi:DNA-binding NtrC family response regulator
MCFSQEMTGMKRELIVIIESHPAARRDLSEIFESEDSGIRIVSSVAEALRVVKTRGSDVKLVIFVVRTRAMADKLRRAIEPMPAGPIDGDVFIDASGQLVLSKPESVPKPRRRRMKPPGILGSSPAAKDLRRLVDEAARSDRNLLITGETGVGKQFVAQVVHRQSARGAKRLVEWNCAIHRGDHFESRFFGVRRGAREDARDSKGLVEAADGSDLLLHKVESLSLDEQAKLLEVMERGEVRPLGAEAPLPVSVRFIAVTRSDPEDLVARGELHRGFLDRLRELEIHVPPLRERVADIPVLVRHFLRPRGSPASVSPAVMKLLARHAWPGNVRELRNALSLAQGRARSEEARTITLRHLYEVRPAFKGL